MMQNITLPNTSPRLILSDQLPLQERLVPCRVHGRAVAASRSRTVSAAAVVVVPPLDHRSCCRRNSEKRVKIYVTGACKDSCEPEQICRAIYTQSTHIESFFCFDYRLNRLIVNYLCVRSCRNSCDQLATCKIHANYRTAMYGECTIKCTSSKLQYYTGAWHPGLDPGA